MEPVSALGVAAAALQFLQFGSQVLNLCKQIRDNADGATEANQELERRVVELKGLRKDLPAASQAQNSYSRRIMRIGFDCAITADELLALLQHVRGTGTSKASVAGATFRALKERRTIEKLQNKLKDRQQQLDSALLADVHNKVDRAVIEQSKEFATLRIDVQQRIQKLFTRHAELVAGQADIQRAVKNLHVDNTASHERSQKDHALLRKNVNDSSRQIMKRQDGTKKAVTALGKGLHGRLDASGKSAAHKTFLDSLKYEDMTRRQESIRAPWDRTYDWIFDADFNVRNSLGHANFERWLRTSGQSYWISGKAGSGKSTLMAFLLDDRRTRAALREWAGTRPLNVFMFFFWRAGSAMQKTVPGLLRALLYQVVNGRPAVADSIMRQPSWLQDQIWTETRLVTLLDEAFHAISDERTCIFLDGLDEFEGDYGHVLDLLTKFAAHRQVKFCISSRPETAIKQKLSEWQNLRLEDLNYQAIKQYTGDRLSPYGTPLSKMISEIARAAHGIFLWATLVTADIIEGFQAGDNLPMLKARLSRLPRELEDLFAQLFAAVDPLYMDSLELYLDFLANEGIREGFGQSLALLVAIECHGRCDSYDGFNELCALQHQQVMARSKGLIEIVTELSSSKGRIDDIVWWRVIDMRGLLCSSSIDASTHSVLQTIDTYWRTQLQWTHRSAFDFVRAKLNRTGLTVVNDAFRRRVAQGLLWLLPRLQCDLDISTDFLYEFFSYLSTMSEADQLGMYESLDILHETCHGGEPSDECGHPDRNPKSPTLACTTPSRESRERSASSRCCSFWLSGILQEFDSSASFCYLIARYHKLRDERHADYLQGELLLRSLERVISDHAVEGEIEMIRTLVSGFCDQLDTQQPSLDDCRHSSVVTKRHWANGEHVVTWDERSNSADESRAIFALGAAFNTMLVYGSAAGTVAMALYDQLLRSMKILRSRNAFMGRPLFQEDRYGGGKKWLTQTFNSVSVFESGLEARKRISIHGEDCGSSEASSEFTPIRFRLLCLPNNDESFWQSLEDTVTFFDISAALSEALVPLLIPPNVGVDYWSDHIPRSTNAEASPKAKSYTKMLLDEVWADIEHQLDPEQQRLTAEIVKLHFAEYLDSVEKKWGVEKLEEMHEDSEATTSGVTA